MLQNAADDDLRRKPTNSRRLGGQVDWTVTGRALIARHQTFSRILDSLPLAHRTFGDAVKQEVAIVQGQGDTK